MGPTDLINLHRRRTPERSRQVSDFELLEVGGRTWTITDDQTYAAGVDDRRRRRTGGRRGLCRRVAECRRGHQRQVRDQPLRRRSPSPTSSSAAAPSSSAAPARRCSTRRTAISAGRCSPTARSGSAPSARSSTGAVYLRRRRPDADPRRRGPDRQQLRQRHGLLRLRRRRRVQRPRLHRRRDGWSTTRRQGS